MSLGKVRLHLGPSYSLKYSHYFIFILGMRMQLSSQSVFVPNYIVITN